MESIITLSKSPTTDMLERILQIDGGQPSANPYTSTGFIVWYCFLILCCGLPMCCCCVSYCCYKYRRNRYFRNNGNSGGADDDLGMFGLAFDSGWDIRRQEEDLEELEREISRIEANVTAFSLNEQKRRRSFLMDAWRQNKMIVTEEKFIKEKTDNAKDQNAAGHCNKDESCTYDEDDNEKNRLEIPTENGKNRRKVSCNCPICLTRYEPGETVVWSSNTQCPHVFHETCIVSWLMTRQNALCPCCRQKFTDDFCPEVGFLPSVLPRPPTTPHHVDDSNAIARNDTTATTANNDGYHDNDVRGVNESTAEETLDTTETVAPRNEDTFNDNDTSVSQAIDEEQQQQDVNSERQNEHPNAGENV